MRKTRRILWIGGAALPRTSVAKELDRRGYLVQCEPLSAESLGKLPELEPAVVVLEKKGRSNKPFKKLLSSLVALKKSLDFVLLIAQDMNSARHIAGADGYVAKGRSLAAQVVAVIDVSEVASRLRKEKNTARRQLTESQREIRRLRRLAVRDDLTCLYNLRFFHRALETEHSRALRFRRDYTLIFMDVDGLRDVNTRHGHLAGGHVLKQIGEFLNRTLRRIDIPARVGGDEFVVICPETSKAAARMLAERLRVGIESLRIHGQDGGQGITASMGVASFPDDGDSPALILERADQSLYEAKAKGKNHVCCWGDFPVDRDFPRGSVHSEPNQKPQLPEPELEIPSSK